LPFAISLFLVFAYGATGSGKTFTMLGSGDSNPGLTILTMIDLYCRLEEMEAEYETSVTVSYLEVRPTTNISFFIPN